MRIVVLDGFTLNPGDLSWEELKSLGDCEIYDRSLDREVLERAARGEILLTNKTVLDRSTIAALSQLQYIGILATGTNVVDLQAARERGIAVTNVPAYGTASVAQATIALLLELTNATGLHSQSVHAGDWSRQPDFCYWKHSLIELSNLTLGIVGFGRIGRAVAVLGHAFGMKIVVATPTPDSKTTFVRFVDLETLLRQSDVVTLHCPLTAETKGLINAQRLSWMKPTALLINSSRGPLIDEPALATALNEGRITRAGLDVLSTEPPPVDNPLLQARNCIITPHCAWATRAARQRLMNVAVENVRSFLKGKPQNVVN